LNKDKLTKFISLQRQHARQRLRASRLRKQGKNDTEVHQKPPPLRPVAVRLDSEDAKRITRPHLVYTQIRVRKPQNKESPHTKKHTSFFG
jgi:hypothetical protein